MPTQSQPTALPKHTPAKPPAAGQAAQVFPIHRNCVRRPMGLKGLDAGHRVLLYSGPRVIAEVMGLEGVLRTDDKANASREEIADEIVRACNSHPALVAENKRLREALTEIEHLATRELWGTGIMKPEFRDAVLKARAALAKEDV